MSITEQGITDTETLVKWLRSIADDVERRGVESMSLSGFATIGTSEDVIEGTRVHKPTKDHFVALAWRFIED